VNEAGFGSYVKTYKPWFIGRDAYLASEKSRAGVVVRFRFNERGVRMAHQGDPVLDKRGKVVGWVTSCAADVEGYLLGQAFVDLKNAAVGTLLFIIQSALAKPSKAPAELELGDRGIVPTQAAVIRRFP
jgi:glycine hydroxymethyltransferase